MDIIKELLEEVNGSYFEELKDSTASILKFRVLDIKEVDKNVFLEKVYDYLDAVDIKNNINVKKAEYLSMYTSTLLALIDNKVVKGSRAEKFLKKAERIVSKISKDQENCEEKIKDFTRIFSCLYIQCLTSKKPLSDFNFTFSFAELHKVVEGLIDEKKSAFLFVKEKDLLDITNRHSKMTYILFFYILVAYSTLAELGKEE